MGDIIISRRWFMLGGAAAVAAATVPTLIRAMPNSNVVRLGALHDFEKRDIWGINVIGNECGTLKLYVRDLEKPWSTLSTAGLSFMKFSPYEAPVVLKHDIYFLEFESRGVANPNSSAHGNMPAVLGGPPQHETCIELLVFDQIRMSMAIDGWEPDWVMGATWIERHYVPAIKPPELRRLYGGTEDIIRMYGPLGV